MRKPQRHDIDHALLLQTMRYHDGPSTTPYALCLAMLHQVPTNAPANAQIPTKTDNDILEEQELIVLPPNLQQSLVHALLHRFRTTDERHGIALAESVPVCVLFEKRSRYSAS